MEQCVNLSKRYAEAVSHELDLPIYLYAEAATNPNRVSLPNIRRGNMKDLKKKFQILVGLQTLAPPHSIPEWESRLQEPVKFSLLTMSISIQMIRPRQILSPHR